MSQTEPGLTTHTPRAGTRSLELNRRFEGLVAWDSFFHLTPADQRLMFEIFEAHAAPGAALLFTGGPRHGTSIGTYHERPLYHSSLDAGEYEQLLSVRVASQEVLLNGLAASPEVLPAGRGLATLAEGLSFRRSTCPVQSTT